MCITQSYWRAESTLLGWCAEFTELLPHCTGEKGGRSHLHFPGAPRILPQGFNNWWISSRCLYSILGIFFTNIRPKHFSFSEKPQIKMAPRETLALHRVSRPVCAKPCPREAQRQQRVSPGLLHAQEASPVLGGTGPRRSLPRGQCDTDRGTATHRLSSSPSDTEPRAGTHPAGVPRPAAPGQAVGGER